MKLSIIMPCWKRPQRTERAIRSVLAQDCDDWELLCIGDECPSLPAISSKFVHPKIISWNVHPHEGRFGTQCLNAGIQAAHGEYLCFLGNDDFLTTEHVGRRLDSIVGSDFDFVHHDAMIAWADGWKVRSGQQLAWGHVGGSELVVKSEFLRRNGIKFRSGDYGHDWTFIEDMLRAGAKYSYFPSATYVVTHLPGTLEEQGID